MSVVIAEVTAEHHHCGFAISHPRPRLSWRFASTTVQNWIQASYTLVIVRNTKEEVYEIKSPDSVLVPWPSTPLASREAVHLRVRAVGHDGFHTQWATLNLEAALLDHSDWQAGLISRPPQSSESPKRPFRLRKTFNCAVTAKARMYATAHGIYQVEINGNIIGNELLAPGWQSYKHRLHYQSYDISSYLVEGDNVVGAYVADGWFAGRLGRPGVSNIFGQRLGFLGQIEVGGKIICSTDSTWEYLDGPIVAAEIYNGEIFDSAREDPAWSTLKSRSPSLGNAEELSFPSAALIAPDVAPVRRIEEIKPVKLITTPTGKAILDFGRNVVGWLKILVDIPGKTGEEVRMCFAEVLEGGELGTRPLRTAKAENTIMLGGRTRNYEPRFTWFGFRYAEITGYSNLSLSDFVAVVISSDLRRTGSFHCSHALINQLHVNTIASTRGNFLSVPTDCPQRDERLGWTGDIAVFAPTANFLFDTSAFLSGWLEDLAADQRDTSMGGVVPVIIPKIPWPPRHEENRPMAIWADCCITLPWDLFESYGDEAILKRQWDSMRLWLDKGIPRGDNGLYSENSPQYADWLDPRAPPQLPGHGPTDPYLIANAYLIHVTRLASEIAMIIGESEAALEYTRQADQLAERFDAEYISKNGRLACDTQTTYLLALLFRLLHSEDQIRTARARLDWLIRWDAFKITTGFAGTPIILQVLAENGMLNNAYRLLQERDCPSWLYPVSMGATTIWERWDSMLPDGRINPGQMTSFNHYALGSVCNFLHRTVGGLSASSPGWKTALISPKPGGTVRQASTSFDSPYGPYGVEWECAGSKMLTKAKVPPNGKARVVLNGVDVVVGSGEYIFETEWTEDPTWPPTVIPGPEKMEIGSHFVP